jgi:isopenicillin N synthase-like dioxygenase
MTHDFTELPVVDLQAFGASGDERAVLAAELVSICHEIGFFVVVNHRVATDIVDAIFDMMQTFFALPSAQKELIDKRNSPHFRGWESVGSEQTNNRPDMREQIDVWSEWPARTGTSERPHDNLHGPNQWMPDAMVPRQREIVGEWFRQLGQLGDQLLGLLSLGLGLGEEHLRKQFGAEPMSLTKLISYPPTPAGHAGVNPHHDTGFLTVLAPGPTPGLQVQNPAGLWVPVPYVAKSFVINLGEMLQAMTGNYLVATPHRVITHHPRQSAGYFHGPSLDTRLDPLPLDPSFAAAVAASPRHATAGFMAGRAATEAGVADMAADTTSSTYGEQLWNYFARSYPENMATHYPGLTPDAG